MDNNHDPKQPYYNFEQAVNYLSEKKETLKEDIHKEAGEQKITTAPEGDRQRYLKYCISLLDEVDGDLMSKLPDNIRNSYTQKEMAMCFKMFLGMKIAHQSDEYIAHEFGVPLNVVQNLNVLAQEAVWRAIKRKREVGTPLVGGI